MHRALDSARTYGRAISLLPRSLPDESKRATSSSTAWWPAIRAYRSAASRRAATAASSPRSASTSSSTFKPSGSARRSARLVLNADHGVAPLDRVERIETFDHLAEDRILPVEKRRVVEADVKLRTR